MNEKIIYGHCFSRDEIRRFRLVEINAVDQDNKC